MSRNTHPDVEFHPFPVPRLRIRGAPLRIITVVGIILVVGLLCHLTPWETEYRAGSIPVIESELAALSPPTDAAIGTPIVSPDTPLVGVEYVMHTKTCNEIETYYERTATQTGWKQYKRKSTDLDVTWSYAKVSQGYQLTFDLTCQEDAATTSTPPH